MGLIFDAFGGTTYTQAYLVGVMLSAAALAIMFFTSSPSRIKTFRDVTAEKTEASIKETPVHLPSTSLTAFITAVASLLCCAPVLASDVTASKVEEYGARLVAFPTSVPGRNEGDFSPLPSLADMLERVNPAVVNIATWSVVRESNRLLEDPFFRRFFNVPKSRQRYRRTQSAGSGCSRRGVRVYRHQRACGEKC